MDDRRVEQLLAQSQVQRRLGNPRGAVDLAQRALAIDPDHARAHAFLAIALVGTKRLAGALIEARTAVTLDAEDEYTHRILAIVLRAHRRLDEAWSHALVALERPDPVAEAYVVGADIVALRGDKTRARELVDAGLELDPDNVELLTSLARLQRDAGDRIAAQRTIERALEADPSDADAHVTAGHIALLAGDAARAEEHARFALNQQAEHADAMRLWIAIQARRSKVLGAWWHWSAFVSRGSETRRIGVMLGMFVVARVATILAEHYDHPRLAAGLRIGWLALCAYTWIAPYLFRKMLARSLGKVSLDPDY